MGSLSKFSQMKTSYTVNLYTGGKKKKIWSNSKSDLNLNLDSSFSSNLQCFPKKHPQRNGCEQYLTPHSYQIKYKPYLRFTAANTVLTEFTCWP